MLDDAHKPCLYIVSDGRGETCSHLLQAALVQFEGLDYHLERRANVRSHEQVRSVVQEAHADGAMIFYTLVSPATRMTMKDMAEEELVPTFDVLGPVFSALYDLFEKRPRFRPGLLYESDRDYFNRADAIDYSLKHDDGLLPHDLDQADVVLVGVSRASKSSTSFYLAYEGIRVANVPLVPDVPPHPELLALDPQRVIGLKINVPRLRRVRESRVRPYMRNAMDRYLDKREIALEIRYANDLMARHGWRSVDISYKAIEEIAREIIELCDLQRRSGG